jgi:predicted transcriptional regulator
MKVAVSIPDSTFSKAEMLAQRLRVPRSALYARALDELVAREGVSLTEQINAALDEMTEEDLEEQRMWTRVGAETVLKHTKWP